MGKIVRLRGARINSIMGQRLVERPDRVKPSPPRGLSHAESSDLEFDCDAAQSPFYNQLLSRY